MELKVNLLDTSNRGDAPLKPSRWFRRVLFCVVLLAGGAFATSAAAPGDHELPFVSQLTKRHFFQGVGSLLTSSERGLEGENEDRVNILLLGIGGDGHDGPQLTDTVILASYKPSTKQVALLSLPRDLLVDVPGRGPGKLNAVNAYAEMNKAGSGGEKTAESVSKLLGVSIPYYVRVDFSGFEKLINSMGGVLVYVDRPFTDAEYPAANDLYQTVSYKAGWQRMNGNSALVYARSRHGNNFEGGDYARSKRQQKILTATKEELLSTGTLTNPARLLGMYDLLSHHVLTNLAPVEMLRLATIGSAVDSSKMVQKTLDPLVTPALVSVLDPVNGYILVPQGGDMSKLRDIAANIFAEAPVNTPSTPAMAALQHPTKIELQNGTALTGFATKAATTLKTKGYIVSGLGNARSANYSRSVIYDLSNGKYPTQLADLRTLLDADVSVTLPEWFKASPLPPSVTLTQPEAQYATTKPDFLVILGKSSSTLLGSL